jgi:anti-sigma B factor antagonist
MRIDASFDEGVVFLSPTGDIDLATADELKEAGEKALTEYCGTLRIDLSGVTFIDSTGLGALIHIRNAAGSGTSVILENPPRHVRRIFEITGLAGAFTIEATPSVVQTPNPHP